MNMNHIITAAFIAFSPLTASAQSAVIPGSTEHCFAVSFLEGAETSHDYARNILQHDYETLKSILTACVENDPHRSFDMVHVEGEMRHTTMGMIEQGKVILVRPDEPLPPAALALLQE